MSDRFQGATKIFAFTFRHQAGKKSYLLATILVAILCVLIPAGVMCGIATFSADDAPEAVPETGAVTEQDGTAETAQGEEGEMTAQEEDMMQQIALLNGALGKLHTVYVVDTTDRGKLTAESLSQFDFMAATGVDLADVTFIDAKTAEEALTLAAEESGALVLVAEDEKEYCNLHLVVPESSATETSGQADKAMLRVDEAEALLPLFEIYGQKLIETEHTQTPPEDAEDPMEMIIGVLSMLLPYLNIMVLYFFVLIYGQSVAQSVVLEKNSKLMDNFLLSVKPEAMVLGKVLAVGLAGVLQLGAWIIGLVCGFALGTAGARAIDPDTDMLIIRLFDTFGQWTSGMFSVSGFLLALLLIIAGMLLYCALAGIGGAVAGKMEDLSTTSVVFTMILIASFFSILLLGGLEGSEEIPAILDWIPFTSIMITPSRVLLGSVSLLQGLGCLAVTVIFSLVCIVLAGRIYKAMALYKGDVPGPKKIWEMVRGA